MEANRAFLLLLARVLGPFTSTVPFFAAEVWFKFRKVLRKWKKKARNVPLAPKRRDRAIERFLVELPETFPCAGPASEES